jgi:hypothetical protein
VLSFGARESVAARAPRGQSVGVSAASGESEDSLTEHATARDEWLNTVGVTLSGEDACKAGLVIGSVGRGTEDGWSDLDLVLFAESSTLIAHLPEWTTRFGRALLVHEAPLWNAPMGGRQVNVWYHIGTKLPLLVDWRVWPLTLAAQPHDTALWFNRADQPLPQLATSFDAYSSSVPRADVASLQPTPEELRRYHFRMVPIAAKYIARRDADRTRLAFAQIGLPFSSDDPHDQVAQLQELFDNVSVGESPDAITAMRRMLRYVADLP